jgi:hypothetical protein
MRIFWVAAVVLIVFAIIASGAASSALFGVLWTSWLCASFLSFLVDLVFPVTLSGTGVTVVRRDKVAGS